MQDRTPNTPPRFRCVLPRLPTARHGDVRNAINAPYRWGRRSRLEGIAKRRRWRIAKWLLLAMSLAVFGIAMLVFSVLPKTIVLIIPTGYRGDILIVKDVDGEVGERRAGAFWFEVPDSGVVRVRDIELFRGHVGGSGSGNRFECHEKGGRVLRQGKRLPSEPYVFADGPWGDVGITVVAVVQAQSDRGPFVGRDELKEFRRSGVPRDFVAPHVIVAD